MSKSAQDILGRVVDWAGSVLKVEGRVSFGAAVAVRTNVAADDAADPAIGNGADCSGARYALLEIDLTGSDADETWTLTPLTLNSAGTAYNHRVRESLLIAAADGLAQEMVIQVDGNTDVSMLCTDSAGTTPTIAALTITPIRG
jgi:VCBS repeat-containing protein